MQQLKLSRDIGLNPSSPPHLRTEPTGEEPCDTPRVLLVLRSQLLREGLKRLLTEGGFLVAGEATNQNEASNLLASVNELAFDLVIIDASLCEEASRLQPEIRATFSNSRIIILADDKSIGLIGTANLVDADGILSSEISPGAMIQSLRLIQLGERVVPSDLIVTLLRRNFMDGTNVVGPQPEPAIQRDDQSPTPRETQILQCLISGSSNKIIARQLGITEATVKVHVKGLLRKIRASNRTQAAIWALNNGIEAYSRVISDRAGSHV